MREVELANQLELRALADADRRRRPLADAVDGEHRGFGEGRRVEGAGRVRLVVLGEPQPLRRLDAAATQ